MNIVAILIASVIPMVMGFIWYNPKVMGKAWMKETGLTEEKLKGGNMAIIFGVSFLLCFFMSFTLQFMVIHQTGITASFFDYSEQIKDATTPEGSLYKSVMDLVGTSHRTFKHGALHGFITGLLFLTPSIGITSLYERKSFKYVSIHAGYWIISLMIMGGIISAM